jgi:hypothetical protein
MIQNPAMCSFVSANGPSLMVVVPFSIRTTVALSGVRSPPPKTQAPAACISSLIRSVSLNMVCVSSSDGAGAPSTKCTESRYCFMTVLR